MGRIVQSRPVGPMIFPQERTDKQNVEDLTIKQKIVLRIAYRL
jgi:hypothetical protein